MLPLMLLIIGLAAALLEEQVGGQHTVGVVLAVIGGVLLAIQVIVGVYAARQVRRLHNEISDEFRDFGRRL